MTLLVGLLHSGYIMNRSRNRQPFARWMAALLLLLVIIHVVTEIDRNQHNRDDHAEQ